MDAAGPQWRTSDRCLSAERCSHCPTERSIHAASHSCSTAAQSVAGPVSVMRQAPARSVPPEALLANRPAAFSVLTEFLDTALSNVCRGSQRSLQIQIQFQRGAFRQCVKLFFFFIFFLFFKARFKAKITVPGVDRYLSRLSADLVTKIKVRWLSLLGEPSSD